MRVVHAYAERHPDLTRSVLTRAAGFRTKRLIVVLTPGYELRSGGVRSIAAIYRECQGLTDIHRAKVALCTVPGDDPLFLKYSWFQNDNYLLDLNAVLRRCPNLEYFQLHVGIIAVNRVLEWLNAVSSSLLRNIPTIHINILLQNIDFMEGQNIAELKRFGKVTCTTAHEAYTNSATREAMGVPLHGLSVCIGPENYSFSGYREKEPLLIVSPDSHPLKEKVLHRIAQACPDLTIKIIENLSYGDYLELARRAKWSLTFGEGLDGYFVEPVFSGGVPFAVFNDRFFTPPFSNLETVYPSWEILLEKITEDIKRLDEPVAYNRCRRQAYELLCGLYSTERFRENLRMFYRGEYTFP